MCADRRVRRTRSLMRRVTSRMIATASLSQHAWKADRSTPRPSNEPGLGSLSAWLRTMATSIPSRKVNTAIVVAVIGGAATVIAAVIGLMKGERSEPDQRDGRPSLTAPAKANQTQDREVQIQLDTVDGSVRVGWWFSSESEECESVLDPKGWTSRRWRVPAAADAIVLYIHNNSATQP